MSMQDLAERFRMVDTTAICDADKTVHAISKLAELRSGLGCGGSTPEDLAGHLRHDRLVITTNGTNWTIDPADEQALQTEEAHPQQMRMSFVG